LCIAASLLFYSAPAQSDSEEIYFDLPPGFEKVFEDGDESFFIHEWVPQGETASDWSQMLTLTVQDLRNLDPVTFFNHMADGWEEDCPEYGGMLLHEGLENNYPVAVWFLKCPNNSMTNKPEFTYVKGISGNDNFYTIQMAYALRSDELNDSIVNRSMAFLKQAFLCDDSRPQTHACN
tara:strand:- start:291 stop:824 length:534 start_codon:yes stop_codon:yes gene_type:complete